MNIKYHYEKLQFLHKIIKGEVDNLLEKYFAINEFESFAKEVNKKLIVPYNFESKKTLQHKNKVNKLLAKLLACISVDDILQAKVEIENLRVERKKQIKEILKQSKLKKKLKNNEN